MSQRRYDIAVYPSIASVAQSAFTISTAEYKLVKALSLYDVPDYRGAMKPQNSRKVIQALASHGGTANFSDLERASGARAGLLTYHLNRLRSLGLVESEVKGTYRLRYRTPLCFAFESRPKTPWAYIGLMGRREQRETPEPKDALELLKREGITPKLTYVITSPEAVSDWKHLRLPYEWILCYEDEMVDIDAVRKKVQPQLEALLRDYLLVMDCTSSTKPATIAFYQLAQTYLVPLVYVQETTRRLKWLISRNNIMREVGLTT
jgi:DNA-binding transcriptional ArsR family regulator